MQSGVDVAAGIGTSREVVLDVELVGSTFRGRWCVMSTCLCLPQLRERPEQQSDDFGMITRLGGVATLNIQRLVYRPSDVAWNAIASHLLFVLRHLAMPPSIRLQAAPTLDDILAHAASRAGPFLAQQIMLGGLALSASMELRRLGLETLHQILQASGHTLLVGWETIFEVLGSVRRLGPF
jgi:hypothetical protein